MRSSTTGKPLVAVYMVYGHANRQQLITRVMPASRILDECARHVAFGKVNHIRIYGGWSWYRSDAQ